jgi:hypothetical protein
MEGFEFYPWGYRAVYAWLTNENLALIGVNWTGKDFSAVRADSNPRGRGGMWLRIHCYMPMQQGS